MFGKVAKWSNAADCKSVPYGSGVQIPFSPPLKFKSLRGLFLLTLWYFPYFPTLRKNYCYNISVVIQGGFMGKQKVAVVGTGMVGASYAYSLVNQGLVDELLFINIDEINEGFKESI